MEKTERFIIEDLSYDGLGVAYHDDRVFLIENALVGETVLAKVDDLAKRVSFGKTISVIVPSPSRMIAKCPYFGICGGCNMLHMNYEASLHAKASLIKNTLHKIGHVDVDEVVVEGMDNPFAYRNKIQLPLSKQNGEVKLGYYKRKSHEVIDISDCLLSPKNANECANIIREGIKKFGLSIYDENRRSGIIRHIIIRNNEDDEIMVVIVANMDKEKATEYFKDLVSYIKNKDSKVISIIIDINRNHNNVILGYDSIVSYGKDKITSNILGIKYELAYNSFFQVNRLQAEKLYSIVLDFANLKGNENVIDAYSGVGSISLQLAKHAKHVYGIEIIKEAIDNANNNMQINNMNNLTFILGKVEEKINDIIDNQIDLIVFDPPRKGLDISIIEMLKEKKIPRIIYVSCNYSTLSRDIDLLSDCYRLDKIKAVDMFPWSTEVETVVSLSLKTYP